MAIGTLLWCLYRCSCPGHPGYSQLHTWLWGHSGTSPGCFGTQAPCDSYEYQSHTRQCLKKKITASPPQWIPASANTQLQSIALQKESQVTDLCSYCCLWAHNQSRSWPLADNGMSPLCWCSALLPDSCSLPVSIHWCLEEGRRSISKFIQK